MKTLGLYLFYQMGRREAGSCLKNRHRLRMWGCWVSCPLASRSRDVPCHQYEQWWVGGVHFPAVYKAFTVHTYFTFVSPLGQKSKRSSSAIATLDMSEKKKKCAQLFGFCMVSNLTKTTGCIRHEKASLARTGTNAYLFLRALLFRHSILMNSKTSYS